MGLKKITLSADEAMIERARRRAEAKDTTLIAEFRRWLAHYAEDPQSIDDLKNFMEHFKYAKPGKKFTRDEMNG
jgi:hypothetical protein